MVLDAGDLLYPTLSPVPLKERKAVMDLKAQAIIDAFNHMGCDAITIGDDEMLWGKENLLNMMKRAQFPVVSANLMDSGSGSPLFPPYVIKEMEGFRVGLFGLFSIPKSPEDDRYQGITVLDPFKTATQVVSELREKTDLVILLSHLSYAKDLELAKNVEGLGVIVGGHTAFNLSHPRIIHGTVVVQVGRKGKSLGRMDISFKDFAETFVNVETREMLKKRLVSIEAQQEQLNKKESQDPGKTAQRMERLERRKAETERILRISEDHNEIVNRIVALRDDVGVDPGCEDVLRPYLLQISEAEKTPTRDEPSPPSPEQKPE